MPDIRDRHLGGPDRAAPESSAGLRMSVSVANSSPVRRTEIDILNAFARTLSLHPGNSFSYSMRLTRNADLQNSPG